MLLDWHMPEKDGLATATSVRELARNTGLERLGGLPLIAFTADPPVDHDSGRNSVRSASHIGASQGTARGAQAPCVTGRRRRRW